VKLVTYSDHYNGVVWWSGDTAAGCGIPFRPDDVAGEGEGSVVFSKLTQCAFKRLDRLRLGGFDPVSKEPLYLIFPKEDAWDVSVVVSSFTTPVLDEGYVPCSVNIADFERYYKSGIISGIHVNYPNDSLWRFTNPAHIPVILRNPPDDVLSKLKLRRVKGHGVFRIQPFLQSDQSGVFVVHCRPEEIRGLDQLKIVSIGDRWTALSEFRVHDPSVASHHAAWLKHAPINSTFRPWARDSGIMVPFSDVTPDLFQSSAPEFHHEFLVVRPSLFPESAFSDKVVLAKSGNTAYAITPNSSLIHPFRKLSRLPSSVKSSIASYRLWLPGVRGAEMGSFYCLAKDVDHLLAAPAVDISSLKKIYIWMRPQHAGFSDDELDQHDAYLKVVKLPGWNALNSSVKTIPTCMIGGSGVPVLTKCYLPLAFFQKHFLNDPDVHRHSPISNTSTYFPISFKKLVSNTEAFQDFLLTLNKETPFFIDLINHADTQNQLMAALLSQ